MNPSVSRTGPFLGLFAATGEDAPQGYAHDCRNINVRDGRIRPRFGYLAFAATQSGFLGTYGFEHLSGYDNSYVQQEEWVSIEDIGTGRKPFSIATATGNRTEITNAGAHLALDSGEWRGIPFNGTSYWLNPDATTQGVYKHDVGNPASWTPLVTHTGASTTPPANPALVYATSLSGYSVVKLVSGTDLATFTVDKSGTKSTSIDTNGNVVCSVTGLGDDGTNQNSTTTITFGTGKDFSGSDYIGVEVDFGAIFPTFATIATGLELLIGGAWIVPTGQFQDFRTADNKTFMSVACIKGIAGLKLVQGFRIRTTGFNNGGTGVAQTVKTLVLGGAYLQATDPAHRLWDGTLDGGLGIVYGCRYATKGASPLFSTIYQSGLPAADTRGFGLPFGAGTATSSPLGATTSISFSGSTGDPWPADTTSASVVIQYLRQGVDGQWRLLKEQPNVAGTTWIDRLEENALSTLPVITDTPYIPPPPTSFDTANLVAAFPFKGSLVWLYKGGKSNVRFSKVGDPEGLLKVGDSSGDPADLSQPANFTLADDFADQPLGGAQVSGSAILFGSKSVYSMAGDYPIQMSPPRRIPGSTGCAGRWAFANLKGDDGVPGVAYVDPSGEGVWFVSQPQQYFQKDSVARPIELSQPIRGFLRKFLLDDQRASFGFTDMSSVRLSTDDATGALWVCMGKRALVFRPISVVDSRRQWEPHDYSLVAKTVTTGETFTTVGSVISFTLPLNTDGWLDTGVILRAGASVRVQATTSGTCTWNGSTTCTPNGSSGWTSFPIGGTPMCGPTNAPVVPFSLGLAIEPASSPPLAGWYRSLQGSTDLTTTVHRDGHLYVAFNDIHGAFVDNTGSFVLTITVNTQPAGVWLWDEMDGNSGSTVYSRPADTGQNWTSFGTGVLDTDGLSHAYGATSAGRRGVRVSPTNPPPSNAYTVAAKCKFQSGYSTVIQRVGVIARWREDPAATGEAAYEGSIEENATGKYAVIKLTGPVLTELARVALAGANLTAVAVGTTFTLALTVSDGVQTLALNGTTVASATDTTLEATTDRGAGVFIDSPVATGGM